MRKILDAWFRYNMVIARTLARVCRLQKRTTKKKRRRRQDINEQRTGNNLIQNYVKFVKCTKRMVEKHRKVQYTLTLRRVTME